jgi:hypothetical protein
MPGGRVEVFDMAEEAHAKLTQKKANTRNM